MIDKLESMKAHVAAVMNADKPNNITLKIACPKDLCWQQVLKSIYQPNNFYFCICNTKDCEGGWYSCE